MILIINTCLEKLHYFEFVRPIEKILEREKIAFSTQNFMSVTEKDLTKAKKIIICGTSLKDDFYLKHISKFSWIKKTKKPVLGICAGMQIIGLAFKNQKLKKETEIGFFRENFTKDFFGMNGTIEVYHLHNFYYDFNSAGFEIFTEGKIAQAVKHRKKKIYGVLFHPEVRNKELIINFCNSP